MTNESALSDYEIKILTNVKEYGCHVVSVFDPDGEDPSFSYSVGFAEAVGQPEIIIFGLEIGLMGTMVNFALDLCRDGLIIQDWTPVDGLLENHRCIARKVAIDFIVPEYMNSAIWYHQTQMGQTLSEVVQIVWPGAEQGLYPWDEGCDEFVIASQPALYRMELDS